MKNFVRIVFLVVLVVSVSSTATAQKVKPKVKIGPDTTYVDGPLTEDGYIDYVAHINNYLSEGVTAENNAAALLVTVYPGEITSEAYMKRYCKALGIKPVPLKGDYFQDYYSFARSRKESRLGRKLTPEESQKAIDAINKDFEKAASGPWKKKDIPSMAEWMEASEKHLKVVARAAKRSRYYHPMLTGLEKDEGQVIMILLPQVQSMRSFARALMVRSMMNLGEGEIDKCMEDLLTMRRLGNHVSSGATIVEQLVGIAIVGIAQSCEQKMAFSGRLTEKQLLDYREQLVKHRIKSNMVKSFNNCERFAYLDAVQHVMKFGAKGFRQITGMAGSGFGGGPRSETRFQKLLDTFLTNATDWSYTMREGNRIYDKYGKAMKNADWIEQTKVLEELEKEIRKSTEEISGATGMLRVALGGPETRGKMMGKIFVSLLIPALNAASNAEKRVQIMDDVNYIVLSAAAQKARTGEYPASISDFRGAAGKNLPEDRYAQGPFHYRREGDGFIVYSVGPNLKDDQGNGFMNDNYDKGDDYGAGYETIEPKPGDRTE